MVRAALSAGFKASAALEELVTGVPACCVVVRLVEEAGCGGRPYCEYCGVEVWNEGGGG